MHSNTIWCMFPFPLSAEKCLNPVKNSRKQLSHTYIQQQPRVSSFCFPSNKFWNAQPFFLVAPLWLLNINACVLYRQVVQKESHKSRVEETLFINPLLYSCQPFHREHSFSLWQPAAEVSWRKGMDMFWWYLQDHKTTMLAQNGVKRERWSAGGGRGAIFWKSSYSQKNKRGTIQERSWCAVKFSGLKM